MLSLQNEIYWDDWSQLSIFRASKHSGSQVELLASQLTGLMDMKIFYKGKTAGKALSPSSLVCSPERAGWAVPAQEPASL